MKLASLAHAMTLGALTLAGMATVTHAASGSASPSPLQICYDKPAGDAMTEALPIGNGRLGGLIFGGVADERIVLNEDSLWTGDANSSGDYDTMGAYQTLGDLRIHLDGQDTPSSYRRDLDIGQAIAHVSYQAGGVSYHRAYFASHPAQVLVIHLSADKPGAYTGTFSVSDSHGGKMAADPVGLSVRGTLDNGLVYETRVRVVADGGTVTEQGDRIGFAGCNGLTLLVGAGTDYAMDAARGYRGSDPHGAVTHAADQAAAKPFDRLMAEHVHDYKALFDRVHIDLGKSPDDRKTLPTDRRKTLAAEGGDPEMEALLYQYGRYLLISCSRPGGLPANLQGLWNDSNNPPWHSDYHTNINIEMNYWPAEVANLSECHLPLFDLIGSQLPHWRQATAESDEYKLASGAPVRGWAVRTSHNTMGGLGWQWDKTANAWYCQHYWEHYAFTGDRKFLRNTAYPVLKETCEFWGDHLKALQDGRLVVPHAWSPEHGPVEDGVSYSQEIVWDLFTNYIEAADALGVDPDYRAKVTAMRDKLVVPKIGRWGQLQEWMEDVDDPNDHHRHTSHLFGVYPGRQFTMESTPEMVAAAKKSLLARGDTGDVREWSFAWRTALYARMDDGEDAHRQVLNLLQDRNTCPNLFGLHPPMQIDGNFGITAGMSEMLLQSEGWGAHARLLQSEGWGAHARLLQSEGWSAHARPQSQGDEIQLLPALPAAWSTGSVTGLCARGGYVVDIAWQDGRPTRIVLHSKQGGACRLHFGVQQTVLKTRAGGRYVLGPDLTPL
jgi:alpha-L-fucosidase 2